jgi:uncharacterized protein
MRFSKRIVSIVSACIVLFASQSALALAVPKAPTTSPVVDQTNTLTPTQLSSLAGTIAAERTASSNQIAVLMVSSLEGQSIEDFSIAVAREWGIGTKEKNNGVLLVIAKDDRKLRIEVGYGLEGALTDAQSGRIIKNDITPKFKTGDYYGGISSGVNKIIQSIHGEYVSSDSPSRGGIGNYADLFFFVLFIPIWLGSILARSKSWWAGGLLGILVGIVVGLLFKVLIMAILGLGLLGFLFDWVVSNNYKDRTSRGLSPAWWAGGSTRGGGSSGGGGFGGFGGGGFGGGGSSGSW